MAKVRLDKYISSTLIISRKDASALIKSGRISVNGTSKLKGDDKVDDTLLRAIGFEKNDDGIYDIDLTDFFKHPCQHHKNGPNPCDTPKK